MTLMNEEIEKRLSKYPLHSQEDKRDGEQQVVAKYFLPIGRGTWYVLEGQKEDDDWLFFGWVESPICEWFDEYGYFTLGQLESIGFIELDRYSELKTLDEMR